jgi:hypothetical protein
MNLKKLCIAIGLLVLSQPSPAHASNDLTVFGLTGSQAIAYCMNNPQKGFDLDLKDGYPIHMISVSSNGVKAAGGSIEGKETPNETVLRSFNSNKPQIVGGMLTLNCVGADIGGSCVGKREISIAAKTYNVSPFTVWGTNGNVVLQFKDPKSLISSITFPRSTIKTKLFEEDLQIGSIWGNFTGVPSDREQTIYFVGYPSVEVVINPEALKGLLNR